MVEKDQGSSEGQERSAQAPRRRQRSLLPLPAPSVLFDVAQCSQALQEGRVGVVPHGEQPVSHGEAQVVLVEFDEGRIELRSFAHVACKGVCLELKPATQHSQTEGQELQRENIITSAHKQPEAASKILFYNQLPVYLIVWGEDELEDNHQAYQCGLGVIEAKSNKQLLTSNQQSKQGETQKGVHLQKDTHSVKRNVEANS